MTHKPSLSVQKFIHMIEIGPLKGVILRAAFACAVGGLAALYLIFYFHGLDTETAMDQAQLGRQIAAGAGYSTLYIRPMAMWQFLENEKTLTGGHFPDTYNFPLNPALNAVVLRPIKRWWGMSPSKMIYIGDRAIATAGVALFLASVVVTFFLVRSLFDRQIAWMTAGLVLVTDMMWKFSTSGLPQMLTLFFFSLAMFLLHQAVKARDEKRIGRTLLMLGGIALLMGLMTLTQPVTSWIFAGFLLFVFVWFQPRVLNGLLVIFIYAVTVAPWLVRNYLLTGNIFGLSIYSILDGTSGPELAFMSSLQPDLASFSSVESKLRGGLTGQFQSLFGYFGYNIAAAAFFLSLLHIFRRRDTNMMRWILAVMWLGACVGMAFFTPQGEVSTNQLHMLFLPLFAAYGMAFLLVLWGRMKLHFAPARTAFIFAVFLITAAPMAINFLVSPLGRIAWPPYIPPFISVVSSWLEPSEIMCSDMPWATAWYGGRASLLLPATVKQFNLIHDYEYLGAPIGGLYLTPVSGNRPFLTEIARGRYRDWAAFIMRTADLSRFPLQYFTPLPIDNECVFYSNRDRWSSAAQNSK